MVNATTNKEYIPYVNVDCPKRVLTTLVVEVDGPVVTNVLKSSLSWQMLELHLQMDTWHVPDSVPVDSKYVQFCEELPPQ
jgi:hypothetical protein